MLISLLALEEMFIMGMLVIGSGVDELWIPFSILLVLMLTAIALNALYGYHFC